MPIRPWFLAILLLGLLGDFAVTVIVIPLDAVRIVFFGDLLVGELLFRLLQVRLQALLLALAVRRIALTNIGDIGLAEAVTKLLRVDVTAALCHSGVKTFCAWNAKVNRGTAKRYGVGDTYILRILWARRWGQPQGRGRRTRS